MLFRSQPQSEAPLAEAPPQTSAGVPEQFDMTVDDEARSDLGQPSGLLSESRQVSTPEPGSGSDHSVTPMSPARAAFLERERAAWREESEQPSSKARIAAVWAAGPTVDEDNMMEGFIVDDPLDEDSIGQEERSWTEDEELEAKFKHLKEVIEANDSFEIKIGRAHV